MYVQSRLHACSLDAHGSTKTRGRPENASHLSLMFDMLLWLKTATAPAQQQHPFKFADILSSRKRLAQPAWPCTSLDQASECRRDLNLYVDLNFIGAEHNTNPRLQSIKYFIIEYFMMHDPHMQPGRGNCHQRSWSHRPEARSLNMNWRGWPSRLRVRSKRYMAMSSSYLAISTKCWYRWKVQTCCVSKRRPCRFRLSDIQPFRLLDAQGLPAHCTH